MSVDSLMLPAFRFEVTLIRAAAVVAGTQQAPGSTDAPAAPSSREVIGNGGFQECSGLDIEMDVQEYHEGGRNDGVIRRAGRLKLQPLVLKRGMFFEAGAASKADARLWRWMQSIVSGERPIVRYDGCVHVKSADNTVRATWVFERGLPAKVKGPDLNGRTGEIAIEELHIAHEGLHLLAPGGVTP
ncbi:phage tail protein [Betaproteobacteria bacterium GR16-43]|nr:phage tail protein [Betaproteobacteria bacterium GR16-43]